jgi:acyl-CoA thioester hydrolase
MAQGVECYRGVVHPWMCDFMGHMTTRHYTAMFDDASYHMLAALGFTPEHLKNGTGFADVKLTTSFKSELHSGELVVVHGEVAGIGNKSLSVDYRMTQLHTGTVAAEMESVTVQFDLKARRAIALVPEIRAAAEARLKSRQAVSRTAF